MKPLLFGYDLSPYAEKGRVMCGSKNIPWGDVKVAAYEPRPIMQKLTGGYRRIPILQLGSDIYCDSEMIAQILDRLEPKNPICVNCKGGLCGISEKEIERELFVVAIALVLPNLFGDLEKDFTDTLMADRQKFFVGSKVQLIGSMTADDAKEKLLVMLKQLNERLSESEYLSGFGHPNFLDFGIFHNARMLNLGNLLDGFESVLKWFDRMQAIGHGKKSDVDAKEAFQDAVSSAPSQSPIGEDTNPPIGIKIGDKVKVAPTDYGVMPTVGELIYHTDVEIVVKRSDPDAGELHVHFPQHGFVVEHEHTYELIYYDFRARAEPARLLFAAAGVTYTDTRWAFDKQQEDKVKNPDRYPYGQLPVLENNGVLIAQSHTIDRFLAKRFGLFGRDFLERAKIDGIVEHCGDIINGFYKVRYTIPPGEQQDKAKEQYWNETYPKGLEYLERLLSKSISNFFIGDSLSLADIECYCDVLDSPGHDDWRGFEEVKERFPHLADLKNAVENHSGIKSWLKVRP